MELIDRFKDKKFDIDFLQRYEEKEVMDKGDVSDIRRYMEASCCFTGEGFSEDREKENKVELDPRGKGIGAWVAVFLALVFYPDRYFLRKTI